LNPIPSRGGLLAWAIPKFRLPREVLRRDIEYIKRMGVEFRTDTCFGRDMVWDDLEKGRVDAVIIATGTQKSLKIRIRNEDADQRRPLADQRRPLAFLGHLDCLAFLRRYNEGEKISLGPGVLVIGGGNAAVDSARSALRLGAREVTIVYRRGPEEMPADREEIDDAVKEGVKIRFLTAPVRMIAENDRIEGLECIRTELKESDSSHRRSPVPIEGSEFVLRAETVIAAVGQESDYDLVGSMTIDRLNLRTSRKNVFAAGDFVNGSTTVVEAMASGKKAALAVDAYLEGKDT
jgi:NADPH-dependent glutamate synthase beta subunit-like oxidoreductase